MAGSAEPVDRRARRGWRVRASVVAIAAAVSVIWLRSTSPGLNPDGVVYLVSGRALADGRGVVGVDGNPLTMFPPGMPAVVGVGHHLGLSGRTTVTLLNAAMAAAIVLLAATLLGRHVRASPVSGVALVGIACATPLIGVSTAVLSEPAFIVAGLVQVVALESALRARPGRRRRVAWLFVSLAACWAASSLRYVGLSMAGAGAVVLLVTTLRSTPEDHDGTSRRAPLLRALASALLYGIVAVAPLALWFLRNLAADGTLMADRSPAAIGPGEVVTRAVATLGWWLAPTLQHLAPAAAVGLGALVVAIGCSRLGRRARPGPLVEGRPEWSLVPLVACVTVFVGYQLAASMTVAIDEIDSRLLLPAFVPLVVLAAIGVDRVLARSERTRLAVAVGCCLAAAWITLNLAADQRTFAQGGRGYEASSWQESSVADLLRALPEGSAVTSNDVYAVLAVAPWLSTTDAKAELACSSPIWAWWDRPDGVQPEGTVLAVAETSIGEVEIVSPSPGC